MSLLKEEEEDDNDDDNTDNLTDINTVACYQSD